MSGQWLGSGGGAEPVIVKLLAVGNLPASIDLPILCQDSLFLLLLLFRYAIDGFHVQP